MTRVPSRLDDFEFDLNGFLVLRGAVDPSDVAALNSAFDRFPDLEVGQWYGGSQRRDYTRNTGVELHNIFDCGDSTFDVLIDHPAWIEYAKHYAGDEGTYVEGVTIDENIASIRRTGGNHPVHSGGHDTPTRTQYRFQNGRFRCGQLNVLVALTDIGPGDGATMVVPASHKANLPHPLAGDYAAGDRMDTLPGAVEVHMAAGDALLFVDCLMHGGASRTTDHGERRIMIIRYGPTWGKSRYGYRWSEELLARSTPARRAVLEPVPPITPGEDRIPVEAPRLADDSRGATGTTS